MKFSTLTFLLNTNKTRIESSELDQDNLVNEANNCLKFKKHYQDNPFYY